MEAVLSGDALNLSHLSVSRQQWLGIAAGAAVVMFRLIAELRIRAASDFDYPITLAVNFFAHRSRILDHLVQALAAFDLFQGLTSRWPLAHSPPR